MTLYYLVLLSTDCENLIFFSIFMKKFIVFQPLNFVQITFMEWQVFGQSDRLRFNIKNTNILDKNNEYLMEDHTIKNVNNYLNTNIYS
jgi:hypothetical protein